MSLVALLPISRTTYEALDILLTRFRPFRWYAFSAGSAFVGIWTVLRWFRISRQKLRTTPLQGPHSESFLYGAGRCLLDTDDSGALYEAWAEKYGLAYAVPSTLGSKVIILCDPKAIAHFCAKETWTYIQTPTTKESLAAFFGKGLLWAHGEEHKRQRKSLTPAFSIAAIRELTPIFYDLTYKVKGAWDVLLEPSGSAIIDVQMWMNYLTLDIIGLAGFSYNFGALEGKRSAVIEVFDTFAASDSTALNKGLHLLGLVFPLLVHMPTSRSKLFRRLNVALVEISNALISRTQKEVEMGVVGGNEEKSIIGLLIKGASVDSEFHLTKDEVIAQMKVLLIAGYETTSITLTWTLLELSRNPSVQTKLRTELLEHGTDPTYDQLSNDLPYLDAVVHEILRLHPPFVEFTRVAVEDDVIPLSTGVRTKSGELVDSLMIAKGTQVAVSIDGMNRSVAIWGEDAKIFRPSRWLEDGKDGIPAKAKEIQGYRHLLTFVDGPRTCLGKHFAVTEFKAVLTVLIRNLVFEPNDGVDFKIEIGRGVLPRPKIAGEVGCKLPLRVRPYIT